MGHPELPSDFDAETYYALNEDVRAAGVDAARHYLEFGRHEGRLWTIVPELPHNMFEKEADIARRVAAGAHRKLIGGMWDEVGALQRDFLISHGLRPNHKLLDIGCGCLRAGVRLVPYLEPGGYFGTDVSPSLLDAGYREIAQARLASRLPRANLQVEGQFQFYCFREQFDFAIAHSVFTHLPIRHLRTCLDHLPHLMPAGGLFFVTFFERLPGDPPDGPLRHEPSGVETFSTKDPFHVTRSQLQGIAAGLPWAFSYIGEWGHPRAQRMALYTRH